jgi:hypothetical protein
MSDTIQNGMDCANCSDVETNACRRCDGVGRKHDTIQSAGLEDGKPCGHPGCLNHVSHPCEGCGRIGGRKMERTERADEARKQADRYAAFIETLKKYMGICDPVEGKTLDDIYKPESNGCIFCSNNKVCNYLTRTKALADLEAPK